jgi:hypothetical protein
MNYFHLLTPKDIERFKAHQNKKTKDECWEWLSTIKDGSPTFTLYNKNKQRDLSARRLSIYIETKKIPGVNLKIICENKFCINPNHILVSTEKSHECHICNEIKPDMFYKKQKNICKKCSSEKSKKWYKEHREKARNYQLKRNFGISKEEYDLMLKEQNNKCAICNIQNNTSKFFAVDHNHQTNKIRALLCCECNAMLGFCKENIDILLSAIIYIKKYNHI